MRNYHYNQKSQRNSNNNTNNIIINKNYNKALEENKRLKTELYQKTKVLDDYKTEIEMLQEELHNLQTQSHKNGPIRNYGKSNTVVNNINHRRGKSNNILRVNSNFVYDPFDDIMNSGLGNFIFEDIMPARNYQRINPNFNPGDYEDYYEGNNINNLIRGTNNNNYVDDSKIEEDIINQLYPDPDKMTYEQLLEMEENMGSVSKGLTKKQISKIPKIIYNKNRFKKDDNKCVVCQYEFKNGENVTKLTCGHLFHTNCVDTWLSKNKVCPMCHKEIIIN